MGSAPEGTMCVYCNEEEAGYIPDGLLGFTCGTCMEDCATHGDGFIDRKRMDRYLHSLRAVTGDRQHPFHQLFLDRDPRNGQGYNLAPFLIWTNQWHRPGHWAAVAAHDDDATVQESDDDASSLLWEDRWEVVMAAELAYRPMLQGSSERQPTWTIDRTLRHWHETAYLGLRTPHGRTVLVNATQEMMRARYATLQAEEAMHTAYEDLRLAHTTLVQAQGRYNQAREHERQYDSGVSGGVRLGWPIPAHEPQLRLAERYESAWAILAWMTAHGPIGNLPARNELAQYYHDQLSHWDRFRSGHQPGGPHWSEDEAETDWENDVGPHNPTLMEHYLADTVGEY